MLLHRDHEGDLVLTSHLDIPGPHANGRFACSCCTCSSFSVDPHYVSHLFHGLWRFSLFLHCSLVPYAARPTFALPASLPRKRPLTRSRCPIHYFPFLLQHPRIRLLGPPHWRATPLAPDPLRLGHLHHTHHRILRHWAHHFQPHVHCGEKACCTDDAPTS